MQRSFGVLILFSPHRCGYKHFLVFPLQARRRRENAQARKRGRHVNSQDLSQAAVEAQRAERFWDALLTAVKRKRRYDD